MTIIAIKTSLITTIINHNDSTRTNTATITKIAITIMKTTTKESNTIDNYIIYIFYRLFILSIK
jgi:hypothetical protein